MPPKTMTHKEALAKHIEGDTCRLCPRSMASLDEARRLYHLAYVHGVKFKKWTPEK